MTISMDEVIACFKQANECLARALSAKDELRRDQLMTLAHKLIRDAAERTTMIRGSGKLSRP